MKSTSDNSTLTLPPALLAELQAAADQEHRPALAVLEDAVHRYMRERGRNRIARKVSEMTAAELEAIGKVEMDARHNHLDAELN